MNLKQMRLNWSNRRGGYNDLPPSGDDRSLDPRRSKEQVYNQAIVPSRGSQAGGGQPACRCLLQDGQNAIASGLQRKYEMLAILISGHAHCQVDILGESGVSTRADRQSTDEAPTRP
ncbi:MAG: hypothetical protein U0931_35715 [Vulcanimicrobiota bacterium]